MFKPGQTGNPGGFSTDIAAVRRLARENSIEAVQKIINLMRSAKDERVRLVAADKVLERAFGKPRRRTAEVHSAACRWRSSAAGYRNRLPV
jgi:hypothetical protein